MNYILSETAQLQTSSTTDQSATLRVSMMAARERHGYLSLCDCCVAKGLLFATDATTTKDSQGGVPARCSEFKQGLQSLFALATVTDPFP